VTGSVEIAPQPGAKTADPSNVVVWLTPLDVSAFAGQTFPEAAQRPRLVQKNKSFDPHVLIVRQGAAVEFPNRDPFFHNVFSLFEGKRFDLGLYEAGSTRSVIFDKPGISYIFCNIHPEMSAVIIVMKTPLYAISGRNGQVVISNVPYGNYTFRIWDEGSLPEILNSLSRDIRVSDRSHSLGTIRLTQPRTPSAGHKNKYGRDYDSPSPANPIYKQP
jgi:plastocyanin